MTRGPRSLAAQQRCATRCVDATLPAVGHPDWPTRRRRLEASSAALASLKRSTVLADVFRIWFDGSCGTISGLRLGRTAQQAVEWEEINAAWGQAVLLLATLAKVCGGWVCGGGASVCVPGAARGEAGFAHSLRLTSPGRPSRTASRCRPAACASAPTGCCPRGRTRR